MIIIIVIIIKKDNDIINNDICAIDNNINGISNIYYWYYLYNLKSVKDTHGRVLLSKLQALACNFIINNTSPWVFFTFSKLYKWYQMAQSVTFTVNFENIDPRHSAWRLVVKFRFFIYIDNVLVFLENAKTIVILIFSFFLVVILSLLQFFTLKSKDVVCKANKPI